MGPRSLDLVRREGASEDSRGVAAATLRFAEEAVGVALVLAGVAPALVSVLTNPFVVPDSASLTAAAARAVLARVRRGEGFLDDDGVDFVEGRGAGSSSTVASTGVVMLVESV